MTKALLLKFLAWHQIAVHCSYNLCLSLFYLFWRTSWYQLCRTSSHEEKTIFFCIFICMEQLENSEYWQLNIYSALQSTVILPPFCSPHLMSYSLKILVCCKFQIGKHILSLKNQGISYTFWLQLLRLQI